MGAHNVYYVCAGAYGQGKVIRESSPAMEELLLDLAQCGRRPRRRATSGSGGWYDVGMVYNKDNNAEHCERSPEHPGHFTCGC